MTRCGKRTVTVGKALKRLVRWSAGLVLVLVILPFALTLWLRTQAGRGWLAGFLTDVLSSEATRVVVADISGPLPSGANVASITVSDPDEREAAQTALAGFGALVPSREGCIALRLPRGAAAVAEVVRALDVASVQPQEIDLAMPSLDDVFVAKTGRRLEGDEAGAPVTGDAVTQP